MKSYLFALLLSAAVVCVPTLAHAQATAAVANSIACSASGASTEVLAAAASRESYILTNTSGKTIRVGFLHGSSTATLDDTNSIQLIAGQILSDSAPSIYIGRVVCMSSDASTATVYVIETRRP